MDNPETLVTLGPHDKGLRQPKQKHNTENDKDEYHGPHQKPNPGAIGQFRTDTHWHISNKYFSLYLRKCEFI